MFGKKLWTWVFALALALGGVSLTGCEQDAGDNLDEAGDNIQDAGEDMGESVEDGVEETTE